MGQFSATRWIAIGLALLVAGCSRGPGYPKTFPVTGEITYKGNPVEGAAISLIPSAKEGRSGSGLTDADGRFVIKTYFSPKHEPAGAIAGDYDVIVTKYTSAPAAGSADLNQTPGPIQAAPKGSAFIPPPRSLVPEKYRNGSTSGLKVTVGPGMEPLSFDLED